MKYTRTLVFLMILIFYPAIVIAGNHSIKNIYVDGNNRIEDKTIISYSGLEIGDNYEQTYIDSALKSLYQTDLFSDVEIKYEDSDLIISVKENYILNQVVFEGNRALDDKNLSSVVDLNPRGTYSKKKVQENIEKIISAYRAAGRFSVIVEPKLITLDYNRIDLVFEIDEGPVTKITDINFIGNKNYSDRALRGEIESRRSNWIDAIFGTGKSYDNDLMEYDKQLLKRFYKTKGYVNFSVKNAIAELNQDTGNFIITFSVDEGDRHSFGEINIDNRLDEIPLDLIAGNITTLRDQVYNEEEIESSTSNIVDILRELGYPFVTVTVDEVIDDNNNTVSLIYNLQNGPRSYIERIEIYGNQRTYDYVIRGELKVAEGDPLNQTYINQSIRNLQNLTFFSNVSITTKQGSAPDKRIVVVDVIEQPTGSLLLGAGYSSTHGIVGSLSVTERNLLGKGHYLSFSTNISGDKNLISISYTEPTFRDSEVSFGFDIFGNETNNSASSFKDSKVGAGVRFGLPLRDNLRLHTRYNYTKREVYDVKDTASTAVKQLDGKRDISELGYSLNLNTLDSNIAPSDGLKLSFSQDLAGLGGDASYLRSDLSSVYYQEIRDQIIGSVSFNAGHIFGWDGDDVLISDSYRDPGTLLRGFALAGISPRDNSTDDALGGNTYFGTSAEVTFPIPAFTESAGLRGGLHLNAATLYDSDVNVAGVTVNDSDMIRTSGGASIFWESPIGMLRFDFTEAFSKESFDETEFFQFSGGTNF